MNLVPFVAPEKMVLKLEGKSQQEILEKLTAPLVAAHIVDNAEIFVADLLRREAQMTTVMENGVALPHARSHAAKRLGLVVGITDEGGLAFDPGSDIRSQLFFCIAVPSFAPTAHIPLLQALANFGRDQKRVNKLLMSKTDKVAARYLSSFKG